MCDKSIEDGLMYCINNSVTLKFVKRHINQKIEMMMVIERLNDLIKKTLLLQNN